MDRVRIGISNIFRVTVAVIFMAGAMAVTGFAQTVKKSNNLNFQVPEDWPIEKRGGIVGPIPTDEYVSMKFKAISAEFDVIKKDMAEKFDALQVSLKSMESTFSSGLKEAATSGGAQASKSVENMDEILAKLHEMESQIARLDRKITNKILEVKAETESKSGQLNDVEKKIDMLQAQIFKLDEEIDYIFEKQGIVY